MSSSKTKSLVAPGAVLQFLRTVGKLKQVKRTGWVNNGVALPESVADHMYRMAMCSFLTTNSVVDSTKCLKLSIVHDLAESIVGDITPFDGVSSKDKHEMELNAMTSICESLDNTVIGLEILNLWKEYEAGESPEAQVVKDFDKFEMILTADEYEAEQDKDLQGFFDSTDGKFKTPLVSSWVAELVAQRNTRRKQQQN